MQGWNYGKRLFYAACYNLKKHEYKKEKVHLFKSVYLHCNMKNVSKTALLHYIGTDTVVYNVNATVCV